MPIRQKCMNIIKFFLILCNFSNKKGVNQSAYIGLHLFAVLQILQCLHNMVAEGLTEYLISKHNKEKLITLLSSLFAAKI